MNSKRLILASTSPRRKKILSDMGLDFVVMPSSYEEKLTDFSFSYDKIEDLAFNKVNTLLEENPQISNALVLGADTVVVIENKILGKPKDYDDAFSMLKTLSGNTHIVVTSICTMDSDEKSKNILSTTSEVTFNELTDNMIDFYIENFKPFDKAGAYGIQELPTDFVNNINGSFENIMGLCSKSLKKVLNQYEDM